MSTENLDCMSIISKSSSHKSKKQKLSTPGGIIQVETKKKINIRF